jgi:plasmid stabilization system protein ParE
MHDYLIQPEARADIDDGRDWYESQQPGRGDEFLVEVAERIREIREQPYVSCLISRRVRAVNLKRSKFIIYFMIVNDVVKILAVQHARANPAKRFGRR